MKAPFFIPLLAWLCTSGLLLGQVPMTRLAVDGTSFTVNATPTFLYGISYYGGLGASEAFVRKDLDEMERYSLNWIRLWANWSSGSNNVSAVDADGQARQPFLGKLEWIVGECDRLGIIVDVTLTRGDGRGGSPRLETLEAHRRAVETVVKALRGHTNWYLDLSNERNVGDKRFTSLDDIKNLRDLAKSNSPTLLVTASDGGDISEEELRRYLQDAKIDFVAPHRPRDASSAARTEEMTRKYLAWMREIGRVVPIHYQEPFRRGYAKWEPRAEDYLTDLKGAMTGGAAGWCFHNGSDRKTAGPKRSFDLSKARLFEQLDAEELKALQQLQAFLKSP
ncbi:MAG TPA: hypothetical protein VMZ27_10860, partial [Candidatus Saccharimonadales bacterium]|nr:hypothetical protein [Candidatus Saccharimonadales bacterium]